MFDATDIRFDVEDVDDAVTYSRPTDSQAIPSDLTKSGKVKWLHTNYPTMTVREIANAVGIRYQFAYNVINKK